MDSGGIRTSGGWVGEAQGASLSGVGVGGDCWILNFTVSGQDWVGEERRRPNVARGGLSATVGLVLSLARPRMEFEDPQRLRMPSCHVLELVDVGDGGRRRDEGICLLA